MRHDPIEHQFVEFIPPNLDQGVMYISIPYATAVHLCACGCGNKVITPLSPAEWQLIFDGDTVSLHPSVGNWDFPCRSHYFVRRDQIQWAPAWSEARIRAGRQADAEALDDYFAGGSGLPEAPQMSTASRGGLWQRLRAVVRRAR
jgi:hypothetical protein